MVHFPCQSDAACGYYNAGNGDDGVEMDFVGHTVPGHELTEGNETCNAAHGGKEYQRNRHRPGSIVGLVVIFGFVPPEDEVVHAEHVEGSHTGYHRHPYTHVGAPCIGCGEDFVLGEEAREGRNTGDCKAADEECPTGDGHVFAETTHGGVVVAVDCMNEATCSEEEERLKHSVSEEVEHCSHVSETAVMYTLDRLIVSDCQRYHHECYL